MRLFSNWSLTADSKSRKKRLQMATAGPYNLQLYAKVLSYFKQAYGEDSPLPALPNCRPSVWVLMPPNPKQPFNEVYPNIFLGNQSLAKNKEQLRDIGITHIVNCAQGTKFNQVNTDANFYKDVRIDFLGLKAIDIATFNMMQFFKLAADFIDKSLKSGGKVYVHCVSGISRSATIVLTYLMLKCDKCLMDSVKIVREKRNIFPNDGFIKQLCILNEELCATK
ncbi:hypothetical protein ScPMuIL_000610 [Solemya velum]